MATTTSTIPAAMDAFVAGMQAREMIASDRVQVASGFLGADTEVREAIYLTNVPAANQEWGALGNRRREETFTLAGVIFAMDAGKNEEAIKAVRDRAFELLGEIEDFLRVDPTISGTVKVAHVTAYPFEQGADSDGRWCEISFEITGASSLRSS